MFDTVQVGKKIAQLRKKKDMTQYDLADHMGISFQAVSNWERGNSMPDISKLPELASLFGVSVDEILGKSNPVVERLAENKAVDSTACTEEELSEAAQVAKPSQLEKIAEQTAERDDGNLDSIKPLLPFLNEESVNALAEKLFAANKPFTSLLQFMSEDGLEHLAQKLEDAGQSITPLLPFLATDYLDEMAGRFMTNGRDYRALLPFLSEDGVARLAHRIEEENEEPELLKPLLPFLATDYLDEMAERFMTNGRDYRALLSFLSEDGVARLAYRIEEENEDPELLKPLLPFLACDVIADIAMRAFEKGGVAAVSSFLPYMEDDGVKKIAEKIIGE